MDHSALIKKTDFPSLENSTENNENPRNTRFIRHLELQFLITDRRQVNPFSVKKELEKISGEKIKSLVGTSKYKLNIETRSVEQTKKCLQITKLCGSDCKIYPHPTFNTSKGLIRIKSYDIDDMDEFKHHLSEQYDIEKIEKAPFIRSRRNETSYIVTFNEEKLPYSVYIPGEVTDTVVNNFNSRPMLCKNCQEYGHTAKRCRNEEPRCRQCAEIGHKSENCSANNPKCHHCNEDHAAGSKNCTKEKEEQKLLDTVQKEKVTFQRARQIITPVPVSRQLTPKTTPFASMFNVTLPKGCKRQLKNPWIVEKAIKEHTGKTPRKCRGSPQDEDTFVIEVASLEESRKMSTLRKIDDHEVNVQVNNNQNLQKGLIYIQGYDLLEFDDYKTELINENNLAGAEHATWITTRDSRTQVIIVTFKEDLPKYMDIPGETMRTVVHEYKRLPNHCKKCLNYGHSKKVCREDEPKCLNCTSREHTFPPCSEMPQCLHCSQQHRTGDKRCQQYKVEEEILAIQAKSLVSRLQAKIIYRREHLESHNSNYAAAVAMEKENHATASTAEGSPNTQQCGESNTNQVELKGKNDANPESGKPPKHTAARTSEKSLNTKENKDSKISQICKADESKDKKIKEKPGESSGVKPKYSDGYSKFWASPSGRKKSTKFNTQDPNKLMESDKKSNSNPIPTVISKNRYSSLVDYQFDSDECSSQPENQNILPKPPPLPPPPPSNEDSTERQSRSTKRAINERSGSRSNSYSRYKDPKDELPPISSHSKKDVTKRGKYS